MLVLAIDSASSSCAVCVWQDGIVRAGVTEQMERGQDQRLLPLILDVMHIAGIDFLQLDKIAITRGPGSFTGLRIGLAAARGIGLAADKPVIGIDRFAIYRRACTPTNQNLLIVLQSKRAELFCKFYPAAQSAAEATMMTPAQIAEFCNVHPDTIITGDVTDLPNYVAAPINEIEICAALAALIAANDPSFLPRPLYIRAPDVTFPKAREAAQ